MEKLVGKSAFVRNASNHITNPHSEEQETPQSHSVSSADIVRKEQGSNTTFLIFRD